METPVLNQKSQQKPTFKPKTILIYPQFKVKYYNYQLLTKTMCVITTQGQTFADSFINIPTSQLDIINKIINGHIIAKKLTNIKTDYSSVGLFKALLIGTWYHLSDERL